MEIVTDDEGAGRHALLVEAAAATFLRNGYASTSMDAVARAAGMSKKTLYQLFPSKLALLEALLHSKLFRSDWQIGIDGDTSEERIVQAMLSFATMLLRPEHIALARMIVADGKDAPALSDAFRRIAIESDLEALDGFLTAEAVREGWTFAPDEMRHLSRLLFGVTVGDLMMERLFNLSASEALPFDMEARIRRGVSIFLRGIAMPP